MHYRNNITKVAFVILVMISSTFFIISPVHAQMMGYYLTPNPNVTLYPQGQQEITEGQKLYLQLQNKQTFCSKLTNDDFDKIGEYIMEQRIDDPNRHAQMNQLMKGMMGDQGETNMHIILGKRSSGCLENTSSRGGIFPMMGWGNYGWSGMIGGNFVCVGVGVFLFWLLAFIDLILLGIFLWKQIGKNK